MESVTEASIVELRIRYRKLLKEIEDTQEELAMIENFQLLGHMMETEELFKEANDPQTAAIDAKVMKLLAKLVRLQAEKMSTNIAQFTYQEYGERMRTCMDMERGQGVSKMKLVWLGKQFKSLFRRSPPLTYLYGALDTSTPPPVVAKERRVQAGGQTAVRDLVETISSQVREVERSEDLTEELVTKVFKSLVVKYKRAKRRPIDYFTFVLDPDSFGTSIENMFHVSFLVKEGKAAIMVSEDTGLPVIRPVGANQEERQEDDKNQVVINICMEDWSKLVRTLNITESSILSE